MEVRSKYHVEAEYIQTENEFSGTLIHSISMSILAAFVAITCIYRYELGCLAVSLLALGLVYWIKIPSLWKRRNALKQELITFGEQELQFTVDQSGLDADEWQYGVGRKKKKKREEIDDEQYVDDEDASFESENEE